MNEGRCRSNLCDAAIAWIETKKGKPMCVNPGAVTIQSYIPDTERTVVVTPDGKTRSGTRVMDDEIEALLGTTIFTTGFVPHWATCKEPDHFRKKK